jgi:hypothetical protein
MKKLLVALLLFSYLPFDSNLSLKAMDSGEAISEVPLENQKGFKAWVRANPKITAAVVVATIATIIGSGIGIHRLATKRWIWQKKGEGKQNGNPQTSKSKQELTPEEVEAKKKLEEGQRLKQEEIKKDSYNRFLSVAGRSPFYEGKSVILQQMKERLAETSDLDSLYKKYPLLEVDKAKNKLENYIAKLEKEIESDRERIKQESYVLFLSGYDSFRDREFLLKKMKERLAETSDLDSLYKNYPLLDVDEVKNELARRIANLEREIEEGKQ